MHYVTGLIAGLIVGGVLWATTGEAYYVAIGAVFGLFVGALRLRGSRRR